MSRFLDVVWWGSVVLTALFFGLLGVFGEAVSPWFVVVWVAIAALTELKRGEKG